MILTILYRVSCSFFCLWFFANYSYLSSQTPYLNLTEYKEIDKQYDLEWLDLQHNSQGGQYTGIAQDTQGYIWITSAKGLSVYDGSSTITYGGPNSKYSLDTTYHNWSCDFVHYSNISDLLYLVLMEERVVLSIDPYNRQIVEVIAKNEGKHIHYNTIRALDDNSLLYFYRNHPDAYIRKYHFSGEQEIMYSDSTMRTEPNYRLNDIQVTKNGIHVHTTNGYKVLDEYGNLKEEYPIWNRYPESASTQTVLIKLSNNEIGAFSNRKFDHLNVAGDFKQLFIIDEKKKEYQDLSSSFLLVRKQFAKNQLTTLVDEIYKEYNTENFLILTQGSIYRLKPSPPKKSEFFIPLQGRTSDISIRESTEDEEGNIYTSYYGGIARLDTLSKTLNPIEIKYPDERRMNASFSLSAYKDKLYWNNIEVDKNGNVRSIMGDMKYDHVLSFIQGDSLIVIPWETNTIHSYNLKTQLSHSYDLDSLIYKEYNSKLYQTNTYLNTEIENQIWIGTAIDGIKKVNFRGEFIDGFSRKDHFLDYRNAAVYDMSYMENSIACASEGGLYIIDTLSREVRHVRFPYVNSYGLLTYRTIYSIEEVNDSIWLLGSDKGIMKFLTKDHRFLQLNKDHPLYNIEFNRNASFKKDDTYYFGSTTGLYGFKLHNLEWVANTSLVRDVKLISTKAFTEGSKKSKALKFENEQYIIAPKSKNIEFEFSFPSYDYPVYYSYNISGDEEGWSRYTLDNIFKSYSLPPGKHQLEVRVSRTLEEEIESSSFKILVEQVWYKKWWAYLIYLSLVSLLIYSIYKYRISQLVKYERLRTKISSDLHDEVGSLLAAVSMQSEILSMTSNVEGKAKFEKLSSMSREAMSRMRDTVWAIDSRMDDVGHLISRMKDFALDINAENRFAVIFNESISNHSKSLQPDIRQNIYLIYKEAMTNAIKHSVGDTIEVTFSQSNKTLELKVKDNGTISNEKMRSSGLGLSNMKMRAENIGAKLDINYSNGFEVSFFL